MNEGVELWDIVQSGGALGVLFVCSLALYKEFRRVVAQRDQLFNLLIKSIQSGHAATSTAEHLISIQEDKSL